MVVILLGLLGIAVLAAVVALVRAVPARALVERGSAAGNGDNSHGAHRGENKSDEPRGTDWPVTADGPFGDRGRIRGTMQPLHAEDIDDVIVLDGYVVVEEASHIPAVLQGPATLDLCQSTSTCGVTGAHLRLQEWIDDGAVLDVEVRHIGSGVRLDVRDGTSTVQFDVTSVR